MHLENNAHNSKLHKIIRTH